MTLYRTAFLGLMLMASCVTARDAKADMAQLQPDGYIVQAWCFGGKIEGSYWVTVGYFDTETEAEEYRDFLIFLANMGATVNHRGEVDVKTWEKLIDEVDLPDGVYLHGFDYRIIPYYDYSQYLASPSTLRRLN